VIRNIVTAAAIAVAMVASSAALGADMAPTRSHQSELGRAPARTWTGLAARTTRLHGRATAGMHARRTLQAAASGQYRDVVGDGHGAPDIQTVEVTSDATGQITLGVTVDELMPRPDVIGLVLLDTDWNTATGAPDTSGADYMFGLSPSENSYGFARWTGTDWDWTTPYTTVTVVGGHTGFAITVNRTELGNTGVFNFWTRTLVGDLEAYDDAPDDGVWNYSLAAHGPQIDSLLVKTVPAAGPKAGKRFTLTPMAVVLAPQALSLPATPDRFACTATLGTKKLAGSGTGRCAWKIPKKRVHGKRLAVRVTAFYQGASKTVPFAYRVR
jgi:hypothetical protein